MLSIVHLLMVLCGYHCHFQDLSMKKKNSKDTVYLQESRAVSWKEF